jgi:hypothetical protein
MNTVQQTKVNTAVPAAAGVPARANAVNVPARMRDALVTPKLRKSARNVQASAASTTATVPVVDGAVSDLLSNDYEQAYLATRTRFVNQYFPGSYGVDDFVHRLETALYSFGFNGDNTVACVDICRDEITATLKSKIDLVFGNSFNINGLGGVITCGTIGIGAGLSHSPVEGGKERYVFFAAPHIAVSPYHVPGVLCRPGRPGKSSACGALCACLAHLKAEGVAPNVKPGDVHEDDNPEYSILKARIAKRLQTEGATDADIQAMDLVGLTKVCERTIAADLEYLISKAVDPAKADYAVITGVQIHSWGKENDDGTPNLEYVQPVQAYAVVNGEKTAIDLRGVPALTPRQSRELSQARGENWHASGEDGTRRSASESAPAIYANYEAVYPSRDRIALKNRAAHFRNLLQNFKANNGQA